MIHDDRAIREAVTRYLDFHHLQALQPRAVLFDMDGVLYDSMPFHARAWKEVADEYGLTADPADFYRMEGRTGASTVDELFGKTFGRQATEQEKESVYRKKSERFNRYNDGIPMPGAAGVLERVRAYGLIPVLVTGSGQRKLIAKLEEDYPDCFTSTRMVTGDDVRHGKPDPEPYRMGLEKAGVTPNEALVVENAPLGVESAVRAGIFTLAVNTGPLPDRVLKEAGASLLYPDMQSLAVEWDRLMEILHDYRQS